MMVLDIKYNIGDLVYLKTDSEQKERIVTEILITKCGVSYKLLCGPSFSWHYDFEITLEKDVVKKTTG